MVTHPVWDEKELNLIYILDVRFPVVGANHYKIQDTRADERSVIRHRRLFPIQLACQRQAEIRAHEFEVRAGADGDAIGHETPDTDAAIQGNSDEGMVNENYILNQGRLNVELLKNLDALPATGAIIFVTLPNIKDGNGFTSRVFALTPK
ncbi:hypothetical protein FACS189441_8620 [Betaproteobacteria bacterium]|nr:hypothetical protein FACS189441_8620 [Betaproteobacteria bacterium]